MTSDASLPLQPPQAIDGAAPWATHQWPAAQPLVRPLPLPIASRALLAAIAAGLLGQVLFAFQLLGLNFPLWIAVVLAAAWRFRPRDTRFDLLDAWLPAAALVFAAFVALRADGMLLLFDVVAACSLTLAAVVALGGHALTRGSWQRVIGLAAKAIAVYWVGAAYVLPGAKPGAAALAGSRGQRWWPIARGLAIALPLLIVFAVLFAAADAIFQAQLRSMIDLESLGPEFVPRAIAASVAGWLFAGTLACAWIFHRPAAEKPHEGSFVGRLGTTEALVVLVLLNVMFGAFALLQAVYLFGGADTFAASGMTYSDYARRGFFELIAAAFLAGGVIVILDRLVVAHGTSYRVAAAALAALTGVVVLSAFVRLGLYQAAYGWTELRFYALAAIGWLALSVMMTLIAVLANRARWLPQLVILSGLAVAVVCNAVGPQAFVTDQNLHRAIHPELVAPGGFDGLDFDYLRILGADSVPSLVAARDQLQPEMAAQVDFVLRNNAEDLRRDSTLGWQSWNLARQRALDALTAGGY